MHSIHDDVALEDFRHRTRIDPEIVRRLRNALFKKSLPIDAALAEIPSEHRAALAAKFEFHCLDLQSRHDSQLDGASKLVFRTRQGKLVESVILRIGTGRTTLCVSSQFGCAVRCGFCATGQMGAPADLCRDEILDQVVQANRILRDEGRAIRNVVFMGMGEPFHNEMAVSGVIESLASPRDFNLSPAHLLVSTVGIPEAMVRFARRFPRVGMALSLHSARQDVRETLIPLARRFPLAVLRTAIDEVAASQSRPLMVEYLMLDGVNDGDDDLAALCEYLRGLAVHVNLIPYNPIDAAPGLLGTPRDGRKRFAARLAEAGFDVTLRYSLGADIAAACGQLVQRKLAAVRP